MEKIVVAFLGVVMFIGGVLAMGLIMSLPVWLLWNYCLVGAVDGIHEITWFTAWGIFVLSNFLFKASKS
jgi:hypothetical protein